MTPPANDNRPAAFDARVLAYRPGLRRLAYKLGYRGDDAVDLVTDTIIYCLEHWQNFREDGGMWNWLYWQMRGQVSNARARKSVHLVYANDYAPDAATPPAQHDYVELSEALASLTDRGGAMLIKRAMGDELHVVAAEYGISRERVRQLEDRARTRLLEREAA